MSKRRSNGNEACVTSFDISGVVIHGAVAVVAAAGTVVNGPHAVKPRGRVHHTSGVDSPK